MERKPDIETQINETLNAVKSIKPVELPAFFTEKTVNRLRASGVHKPSAIYPVLLKMAAVIVLLVVNVYTIQFILNPKQDAVANNASVKDLVNEYQTSDGSELTFDENLNK